jgi:hypothetical protein
MFINNMLKRAFKYNYIIFTFRLILKNKQVIFNIKSSHKFSLVFIEKKYFEI